MNHKYTPRDKRHIFRGLRHELADATPTEKEKYEREVAQHLQNDKQDEIEAKATEGLAPKKPAKKR